ncbi:GNAT family N-acetyltransferase [Salinispora cortesiana]|uniref:GNAT family N-acetyltransferase n=1 Tax=Salinispora cortesiana TaxID=1305843 RepID=UPI001FDF4396|nr:GNAT family N-acetyltransferase [Salinispora cortesiana]
MYVRPGRRGQGIGAALLANRDPPGPRAGSGQPSGHVDAKDHNSHDVEDHYREKPEKGSRRVTYREVKERPFAPSA